MSLQKACSVAISGGRGPLAPVGFPVLIWVVLGAVVEDGKEVFCTMTLHTGSLAIQWVDSPPPAQEHRKGILLAKM